MIETPRLILRDWLPEDEGPFIAINADPIVMEYFPSVISAVDTRAMIKRIRQHFEDWGYGLYAAELKSEGAFIGFIGLSHPRFENHLTPCVEIGWRLSRTYWNQGLATEGAKAVAGHAFEVLQLEELLSWTATVNKPSERVMQKIGMKYHSNFYHPNLPADDPLTEHVVYHLSHK